jgi:hypothetical protein
VLDRYTASRVLSVVYATEKSIENTGCTHPRDDGIVESTSQLAAHSLRLSGCCGVKSSLTPLSSDPQHLPLGMHKRKWWQCSLSHQQEMRCRFLALNRRDARMWARQVSAALPTRMASRTFRV